MKYTKPPKTNEQLASQLIRRGLQSDKEDLIDHLNHINYYRFSAYLYPYRNEDDTFKDNTDFNTVWGQYTFDRQFRLILIDAIERFEISIKTVITNYLTCKYRSAFPHVHQKNYDSKSDIATIGKLVNDIRNNAKRSKEVFTRHFLSKYKEEKDLPLWMAVELMTFGNIFTLYRCLQKHDQKAIAQEYCVEPKILNSWLTTINYVRNLCAHHSRVWNRTLAIKPLIPRNPVWETPVKVQDSQENLFSVLTIMKYLIDRIAPNSQWSKRLLNLLEFYPDLQLSWMGFPSDWKTCPIWNLEEVGE